MASGSLSIIAVLGVLLAFCVIRVFVGGRCCRGGLGSLVLCLVGGGIFVAVFLSRGAPSRNRSIRIQSADRRSISVATGSPQVGERDVLAEIVLEMPDAPALPALSAPPAPTALRWDDLVLWGQNVGHIIERVSREKVDNDWTRISPTAWSFPDDVIVIGQGEIELRRGHDQRDRKRLWEDVERRARESASKQLAHLLGTVGETTYPALGDVSRKLNRKSRRGREQLASRILKYAVRKTGPQDYPAGRGGPILRQSVRYEISRDRFVTVLLDELKVSDRRSNRRDRGSSSSSRSGRGIAVSIAVIWLLVMGASSVLRAGAGRSGAGS